MAATVTAVGIKQSVPMLVSEVQLSALVAAVTENIAHSGPSGVAPDYVSVEVVTPPTSKDAVLWRHIEGSDSTANNTVAMQFDTVPGGDLTGAVVKMYCTFIPQASGGLTNVA